MYLPLRPINQALAVQPGNSAARAGRLLAISRLGAPDLAIAETSKYSGDENINK